MKKYNFDIEHQFLYHANTQRFEKFLNHYELLKLSKNVKGSIVELGVFKGSSLIRLAHYRDLLKIKKKIYGFDTFKLFPKNKSNFLYDKKFPKKFEDYAGRPIELDKLKKILKSKKIKKVTLIKGNIYQTLNFFDKKNIKISFLHLDLDTENITLYALKKLYKKIEKGGIVVFDDYNIHKGINRAVKKFFVEKTNIRKPLFGINPHFVIKT